MPVQKGKPNENGPAGDRCAWDRPDGGFSFVLGMSAPDGIKISGRVSDLQKQVGRPEFNPRGTTVAGPEVPSGTPMFPGATPHTFNRMKFWTVPAQRGR